MRRASEEEDRALSHQLIPEVQTENSIPDRRAGPVRSMVSGST